MIISGLVIWGFANYHIVNLGYSLVPGISLALGLVGAGAVICTGVLLSKFKIADALRYCGQNSIVIYLAFFVFMATARSLLLKFAPYLDLGLVSLLVTSCGVVGSVLLYWATKDTPLKFLFKRPQWAKLAKPLERWHSPSYVKQLNIKTR